MPDSFDEIKYVEKISVREWWIKVGVISAICAVVPIILLIWHFKRKCRNTTNLNQNKRSPSIEKFDPDKFTRQFSQPL